MPACWTAGVPTAALETAEAARRVIDINLLGAVDTVHAVLAGR